MCRGFKLSETMAMAASAPQSVGVALPISIQRLQEAYLPNHDLERGLPKPLPDMETKIRNRGHRTSITGDNPEITPDSTPTLTPSSSSDEEGTPSM